jgi:7-carboxy-7-deazaguanine synthase
MSKKEPRIPVMEIFGPTIQGEGLMSGTVTHFVRTGGCGLRCEWCDTMFAVDPKQVRAGRMMMTPDEIVTKIANMPFAPYVTLTGGDPCLHKHLGEIILPLNMHGTHINVETQGELFPDWLSQVDVVTFSPKPPSSGNTVDYHDLRDWINDNGGARRKMQVCIKIVVFDLKDLDYAMEVYRNIPSTFYDSFYLSAGTPLEDKVTALPGSATMDMPVKEARAIHRLFGVVESQRALADIVVRRAAENRYNPKFHIGCQQHVLLWPEIEQGV